MNDFLFVVSGEHSSRDAAEPVETRQDGELVAEEKLFHANNRARLNV